MEWKRSRHAKHGTILIETFSHEKAKGKLTKKLSEKLAAHGVTLSPIPSDQVFVALREQERVDPFTDLVTTFLDHFKGAQLSFREVARRAAKAGDRPRAQAFLALFEPIFERYQEFLSGQGQIDFHDMINKATKHVEAGRFLSPFRYILVDEFQDISPGRARLLKALLDQCPDAQLFAVGDDWQSIYRFTGSDIAIMREFADHFGHTEQTYLETTFRCDGSYRRRRDQVRSLQSCTDLQEGAFHTPGGRTVRACGPSNRRPVALGGGAGQDWRGRRHA